MDRIEREKAVIGQMISVYCRRKHTNAPKLGELCRECEELLEYARRRLERCPKGAAKTSCRKCEIHCYAPLQRERIREVMRYVGPRMLLISPLTALRHLISEWK